MRFFFDTCITKRIVKALRELSDRQNVVYHGEMFSPDTPDVDWIRELQQMGDWIIVSADDRIRRSAAEKAAWMESQLTAFFFEDLARRGYWTETLEVIRWWPMILDKAKATAPGTGYLMKFKGKEFRVLYPPRRSS